MIESDGNFTEVGLVLQMAQGVDRAREREDPIDDRTQRVLRDSPVHRLEQFAASDVDRLEPRFPEGPAFMNSSQPPVYIREIVVYSKKRPYGPVLKWRSAR